jgi:membrane associated rhomboid family serine protease
MSQRYFIYPILIIALMQLAPLVRGDRRWYAAQIGQLVVVLLACFGGLYFSYDPIYSRYDTVWVAVAAALFLIFVVMPPLLISTAMGREQRWHWRNAAMFWRLASWFTWGHTGRLYRRHGAALRLMARGRREESLSALDDLIPIETKPGPRPLPPAIYGLVHIWKLSLLVTLRQWDRALAFYESVYDWGTLGLAMQARMFAARALAETGQFERALRSLQLVLLSPRTLGTRQGQLWVTRVAVAALAGDRETVEDLLQHGGYVPKRRRFTRFAAYWRGRCVLARGEFGEAMRMLTLAYGLTHRRNRLWREAIQEQVRKVENAVGPPSPERFGAVFPAQGPVYQHGQELLRRAEKDSAGWRALMHMGRPEPVTLSLLLVLATAHLVFGWCLREEMQEKVLMWAGNSADTVKMGEWWRLFTALFLHANLLHLAMNGVGLWLFGSAVEKTMGRWRMLVVFLAGGALGNLVSAWTARYDVAIGASGGIFAVIGAFAVGVWRLRSPMYVALRRRLLVVVALMVAADFTIGGLEPQVDNLAHVGGFFAGIVLAVVLGARRARAVAS